MTFEPKFVRSAVVVLGAAVTLSACVFSVNHSDDDDDYRDRATMKVRLDNGEYHQLRCPFGFTPYLNEDADGNTDFGCKEIAKEGDGR